MANGTFTYVVGGTFSGNEVDWTINTESYALDVGQVYQRAGYLASSAGEAALPLNQVANPVLIFIRNLDDTNYVEILAGTGGDVAAQVPAGFAGMIPWDSTVVPYILANTASVLIDYAVFEVAAA